MTKQYFLILCALVVAGCAGAPSGTSTLAPAQRPFRMSSLHATYPLVAELRGTYVVGENSIEVNVAEGQLRSHLSDDYGVRGTLRNLALRVSLGAPTPTGWALDTLGTQDAVADSLLTESSVKFGNLRFVLPIAPSVSLNERWLVFQLSADHAGLFNRPAGRFANYICAEENILGPTDSSRARATRMKTEYSKAC